MKKIVVPTDFSESSINALKVAADIVRKIKGAEIHLVHVYERPVYGISLQFGIDNTELRKIKEAIHKEMHTLVKSEFLKGLKTYMHYLPDKEVWEFLNDKHLQDADMVVMGSHGAKGWKEIFVGSNTQKVVQLANCPVLTIKKPISKLVFKELIFISEFSDNQNSALEYINKIASVFEAKLHLLKINTPNFFETTPHSDNLIDSAAKKAGIKNYKKTIFNHISVEDGIISFCKNNKSALIAMETYGRTGVAHLLNGSITEHVINNIDTPALSIKIKNNK